MTFYLQITGENIVTDAISYQHDNYVPYEADSLPVGVQGGWFKLENGLLVEYPLLKPTEKDAEIERLKEQQVLMQAALDDLIFGGGL